MAIEVFRAPNLSAPAWLPGSSASASVLQLGSCTAAQRFRTCFGLETV